MKDQQTKERFMELRAQGWSFARIAKELKVSKQTLVAWSRELEKQIANLKAIEFEALQEKFWLLKEQRMELFGERLKVLKKELENRDLKEIPTERLFELLFKLYGYIGSGAGEVSFQQETDSLETALVDNFKTIKTWKA
ncbi:MAG: helix-turn-helix domain-containing protein [Chloroflexi bacterium]|nr:helix-turn-helix domain-containing protein [Chloroflexota bacterium]